MLILILLGVFFILGIVLAAIRKFDITYDSAFAGVVLMVAFGLVLLAAGSASIGVACTTDIAYELKVDEYESLNARLELADSDPESMSVLENNALYEAVLDYNSSVKRARYWGANPWVNCFCNQRIAKEAKLIELDRR